MLDLTRLDQLTRETLRKTLEDLGRLERMKGHDSTEAVIAWGRLAKVVKEYSRRGLFNLATPQPVPQLLATVPAKDPTRPAESTTLLDQLTAKPSSRTTPSDLSRREFTQRTASLAARAAIPSAGGFGPSSTATPVEDEVTAAKKLVSSFIGTGEHRFSSLEPGEARKLTAAFRIHPDYKEEEHPYGLENHKVFAHESGEHKAGVAIVPERPRADPSTGAKWTEPEYAHGTVLPAVHNAEDHPDYDQALTEKAHDLWNRHNQGEEIALSGHDRASSLVSGRHLLRFPGNGKTDRNDEPVSPHKLYGHDWNDANDTAKITPLNSPNDVKAVLHDQLRGSTVRKGEDIRAWMNKYT